METGVNFYQEYGYYSLTGMLLFNLCCAACDFAVGIQSVISGLLYVLIAVQYFLWLLVVT
jgi:hypothetical protein